MNSNKSVLYGHPIHYLMNREIHNPRHSPRSIIERRISKANNFYRKNLVSHFGCVNAIEFSNNGDLLASGGDDRRVLLWRVSKTICNQEKPTILKGEHQSNIFSLAFDNENRRIFSAGNDDQVIMHDRETGKPLDVFLHEGPVYGLSVSPNNDNVFASACDNGKINVYDTRSSSTDPFCLASSSNAFHSVMFHPSESRLICTANAKEGLSLYDIRVTRKSLIKYGGGNTEQCCMSARFNRNGSQILALRRRLPPVLYSTESPKHLFQFNDNTYYNSCTMKSCSFAGPNDEYVLSGSDNFNLYLWKVPSPDDKNYCDRWVEKAHVILRGSRSIVNQVRYNYAHSIIASSGVEKIVKLWSPFTLPNISGERKSISHLSYERERPIYTHDQYINLVMQSGHFMSLSFDTVSMNTDEDSRMMAFFDALVQRDIEAFEDSNSDPPTKSKSKSYVHSISPSPENSDDNELSNQVSIVERPATLNNNLNSNSTRGRYMHAENQVNDSPEINPVSLSPEPEVNNHNNHHHHHHDMEDLDENDRRIINNVMDIIGSVPPRPVLSAEEQDFLNNFVNVNSMRVHENDEELYLENSEMSDTIISENKYKSKEQNAITKMIIQKQDQLRKIAKAQSNLERETETKKKNKLKRRKSCLSGSGSISSSESSSSSSSDSPRKALSSPESSPSSGAKAKRARLNSKSSTSDPDEVQILNGTSKRKRKYRKKSKSSHSYRRKTIPSKKAKSNTKMCEYLRSLRYERSSERSSVRSESNTDEPQPCSSKSILGNKEKSSSSSTSSSSSSSNSGSESKSESSQSSTDEEKSSSRKQKNRSVKIFPLMRTIEIEKLKSIRRKLTDLKQRNGFYTTSNEESSYHSSNSSSSSSSDSESEPNSRKKSRKKLGKHKKKKQKVKSESSSGKEKSDNDNDNDNIPLLLPIRKRIVPRNSVTLSIPNQTQNQAQRDSGIRINTGSSSKRNCDQSQASTSASLQNTNRCSSSSEKEFKKEENENKNDLIDQESDKEEITFKSRKKFPPGKRNYRKKSKSDDSD